MRNGRRSKPNVTFSGSNPLARCRSRFRERRTQYGYTNILLLYHYACLEAFMGKFRKGKPFTDSYVGTLGGGEVLTDRGCTSPSPSLYSCDYS